MGLFDFLSGGQKSTPSSASPKKNSRNTSGEGEEPVQKPKFSDLDYPIKNKILTDEELVARNQNENLDTLDITGLNSLQNNLSSSDLSGTINNPDIQKPYGTAEFVDFTTQPYDSVQNNDQEIIVKNNDVINSDAEVSFVDPASVQVLDNIDNNFSTNVNNISKSSSVTDNDGYDFSLIKEVSAPLDPVGGDNSTIQNSSNELDEYLKSLDLSPLPATTQKTEQEELSSSVTSQDQDLSESSGLEVSNSDNTILSDSDSGIENSIADLTEQVSSPVTQDQQKEVADQTNIQPTQEIVFEKDSEIAKQELDAFPPTNESVAIQNPPSFELEVDTQPTTNTDLGDISEIEKEEETSKLSTLTTQENPPIDPNQVVDLPTTADLVSTNVETNTPQIDATTLNESELVQPAIESSDAVIREVGSEYSNLQEISTGKPLEETLALKSELSNFFSCVAFLGLNTSQTIKGVSDFVRNSANIFAKHNYKIIIDSNKGYGISVLEGVNEYRDTEISGIYLKPLFSAYSDYADLIVDLPNYTVNLHSNFLDKLKHIFEKASLFIIPECSGVQNFSVLLNLWSIASLYASRAKPLILIGKTWPEKLNYIKTVLKFSQHDLSCIHICENFESLLTTVSKLEIDFSNKSPIKIPKVIDTRDHKDENRFMV